MNKREFANWFNEQVKSRWPRWKVTPVLLSDFYEVFGGYDEKVLTGALRRHRIHDDPSRPSSKRLLEIVRSLNRPKPKPEPLPDNLMPVDEIEKNIPKLYSKEERIKLMATFSGFRPDARELDPQAWDWAVRRGLIKQPKRAEEGSLAKQLAEIL